MMESLEGQFDTQLRELVLALNQSAHQEPNLESLCARIDFTEFYTAGNGGAGGGVGKA